LLQASADVCQEFVVFSHGLGHRSHPCLTWFIGAEGGRFATVDDLERRCLERGREGCIVDELSQQQPAQALPRTVACEATKVHDDDLIGCLGLAVQLGVECYCHVELDTSKVNEVLPEDGGEHWVPIRDDGVRDAV
jgi:hypothetical protein